MRSLGSIFSSLEEEDIEEAPLLTERVGSVAASAAAGLGLYSQPKPKTWAEELGACSCLPSLGYKQRMIGA